ncbi:hypothetical protein PFISCL1PPCAC_12002, partial [Pristionchus fissidentatus]
LLVIILLARATNAETLKVDKLIDNFQTIYSHITLNSTAIQEMFKIEAARKNYSAQILIDNCADVFGIFTTSTIEQKKLTIEDRVKLVEILNRTTNAFEEFKQFLPATFQFFEAKIADIKNNDGSAQTIEFVKKITRMVAAYTAERWRPNLSDTERDDLMMKFIIQESENYRELSEHSKLIIDIIFCKPIHRRIAQHGSDSIREAGAREMAQLRAEGKLPN